MLILLSFTIISTFLNINEGARILAVFPAPSISHQVVFRHLTQELAKRGHEVVVITPNPAFPKGKSPANLTEIDVHDVSYSLWKKTFMTITKGKACNHNNMMEVLLSSYSRVVDKQLQTEEVQHLINDKKNKFDLLLLEGCVRISLGFSHVFKAPVVLVSSFGAPPETFEYVGAPDHPLLYSSVLHLRIFNLTMWEKVSELYNFYSIRRLFKKLMALEDEILQKNFGSEVPSVEVLSNNVDLLLLNSNPAFEGSRPVPPSVVYMGGIHKNPIKELPRELKTYLDSSKNGVIYFSLGTNVDPTILPPEKINVIIKVFSQLPYDVIMKWDSGELSQISDNIKVFKWLPQSDLLRHPKVKLFITQGGLQSTDEAIDAGVPLIGIPMLADQFYNTEKYIMHNIGLKLDFEMLNEDVFMDAIKNVLSHDSYQKNIIKLRELMNDQPQHPLERAVWWIEHVLRHGGAKHLRSPGANITWTEYLELELVFTVFAVSLVSIYFISIVLHKLYSRVKLLVKLKKT